MNFLSILDRLPNPWNVRFLLLIVAGSSAASLTAAARSGRVSIVPGLIVLILSLAVVFIGGRWIKNGPAWLRLPMIRLVVAPILMGLPPFLTAMVLGDPGAGGYPTALSVLLAFVAFSTRELEHRVQREHGDDLDLPVHLIYRRFLGLVSTFFFFFGVVTLWPWLGKMYGMGYFWILVIGVLAPTLYLWERLRQPRKHGSMVALIRFNRVVPYLALVLVIAVIVG